MRLCYHFLLALLLSPFIVKAQTGAVPYGNNAAAGKYIQANGARLYYEVYGEGPPVLLLHGSVFGYISEFESYIPLLAKQYKVVVPALRGHGKSEIGSQPFSYKLFAEDALAILRQEKIDSAAVIGFSTGAITGYYLAAYHPAQVTRLVALAGATNTKAYRPGVLAQMNQRKGDDYERMAPELIANRKSLMPKPDSYNELISRLKQAWSTPVYVPDEKLAAINIPVLTIGGDRDEYFTVASFSRIHQLIPRSQLAIIPNCQHVCLIMYPGMFTEYVLSFLQNN